MVTFETTFCESQHFCRKLVDLASAEKSMTGVNSPLNKWMSHCEEVRADVEAADVNLEEVTANLNRAEAKLAVSCPIRANRLLEAAGVYVEEGAQNA